MSAIPEDWRSATALESLSTASAVRVETSDVVIWQPTTGPK
jgi:hypothetical protein